MIVCKVHKKGKELVLAACDKDLIGKTLFTSEGAEIFINPSFYNGEAVKQEDLFKLYEEATIINLFGKETINAFKKYNLKIIELNSVPHSQIFKIL